MKISLRKANALQLLIQEAINEPFNGEVTIGKFDNAQALITEATDKLINLVDKKFQLIEVLFNIRQKVGAKNAESGIESLLTDLARNEKTAAFYKQLAATTSFAPSADKVEKEMADLNKELPPNTSLYGRRDSISFSVVDKELVEQYKKNVNLLRKEKQVISDKLLNLNVATEIELSPAEVLVLTNYEIL